MKGQKGGETNDKRKKTKSRQEPVELSFFLRKRETTFIFEKIAEDFNDSQDDIMVNTVVVPNPEDELKVLAVKDEFPDIIELIGSQSANIAQYIKGGYLASLDGSDYLERVEEGYVEHLEVDGDIWLIPLSINFRGLFINCDLMEEAGYEIPESYGELISLLEEIKLKGELPMIFPDMDVWTIHQGWDAVDTVERGSQEDAYRMAAEGTLPFQENKGFVDSLEKYIDLRRFGQSLSWETSYDEAITRFAKGESWMFLQGNWAYSAIRKQNPDIRLAFIPFPTEHGQDPQIVVKLDASIAVSESCQHKEEAGVFLNYLLSEEVMKYYTENAGSYSCIRGGNEDLSYAKLFAEKFAENDFILETMSMPETVNHVRDQGLFKLISLQDASYSVREFLTELSDVVSMRKTEFLEMT